jgi:tetratricopeptide (TPR) repeat protein
MFRPFGTRGNVSLAHGAMRTVTFSLFLIVWLAAVISAAAQEPSRAETAPAPEEEITKVKAEPEWDPLRANKSMEVGTFYLKRGNYHAAIDRFEEAARLQPNLARPHLKLGETYEKMKDLPKAVASYRKYLELYRTAPDGNKIRKRIADLERRMAREAPRG